MSLLCNVSFITQYCFIEGRQMCVYDYIKNNDKQAIFCLKGHELILANGKKNKPHFRHKNNCDVGGSPTTLWHSEWQSNFPITETCFPCKPSQTKERRADVVLNEKQVLEIQHSKYEKEEIDARKQDYQLHGIDIIWLIDGNQKINVTILESASRVYLEFADHWKYNSFTSYEFIFIDINSMIYKINPNKVKSHMIDVENGKTKEEFIDALKNERDIWSNEEPEQCNLFIKQQGAGNGKTHGIIKMLEDEDKSHYTNFIYITKQHSAKHIIKTEFESQQQNFQYLKDIEIEENNKKYIIKYFNEKSQKKCQIIISTIDSFTYSIGDKNHTYFNKFEGLIYSIIDGHIETKKCGTINFARVSPKLNKETMLVIDEFQDVPEYYAKAIVQIMRNKYIDVFIVGDKLQSISNEKNAFTYFLENEFPLINIIKLEPSNICRRFIHPTLVKFVNHMIPFEKYGLPEITPYKDVVNLENPLTFIPGKFIHPTINNTEREEVITGEVEKIMEYYTREVYENKRVPNDFLIVTPFTQKNPLVDALLLAINIYWKNKTDEDEYFRYAIFHKSEDGSSIDLSESEYSTRIVSCHSSKGDGRNVVFIIGFNEGALNIFSQGTDNLIYDSLLHVGITRMKEKLYIRYLNNDDISRKINKYRQQHDICEEVKPNVYIDKYIKYEESNYETSYNLFHEIIKDTEFETMSETNGEKRIIDMGNHNIRYSCLFVTILLEIVNNEKIKESLIKKQLIAILNQVCGSDIIRVDNLKKYYALLKNGDVPIIKISNKGRDYIKYFTVIFEMTKHLQSKIKNFLKNKENINLCPLECIILNYMIQIVHQKEYSRINIIDIYEIINLYNNSFHHIDGHENCLCKKHFNTTQPTVKNKKIDDMKLYLYKHFEKTEDIKNTMRLFHTSYPNVNWLMNHSVYHEGNNNFIMSKKFGLIGYDEDNVVIAYIKPQFNSLNYNEIIVNSIFDTHLLNNVKKYNEGEICENYKRFYGKKVFICVFTLDRNDAYYIDWQDSIKKMPVKERLFSRIVEKYKRETSTIYHFYMYWRMFSPTEKPSDFIRFLKEEFEKRHPPKYIDEFILRIGFEIESIKGKTNKELILKNYDDEDYFKEKLEETLVISVKRYLGIDIDEDD